MLKLIAILVASVTRNNSQNVYESCSNMILLENLQILTPLEKVPKTVGDLGKVIIATGFENLPNLV